MMHLNPLAVSFAAAVLVSAVSRDQLPSRDDNLKFIDDIWNEAPVKVATLDRSGVKATSRTDRNNSVNGVRGTRSARNGLPG